jgi:putative ABC transport system permease protein
MLRNYLLIAWRNLLRHKTFSLINISGLAIGMAACLLILQYVSFEWSYDRFYGQEEQIYRLRFDRYRNGSEDKSAGIAPGIGPALKAKMPEVVNFLRLKDVGYMRNIVAYGGRRFNQDKVFFADSSFFSFFNLPLLKGQAGEALRAPNTALITESVALKYFGAEDPVGKVLSISNSDYGTQPYVVTGVLKNLPKNTHLDFQILLSFSTLVLVDEKATQEIGWNSFFTYLLLDPKADLGAFTAKLDQFTQELLGEAMKALNFEARYTLQPLREIHLYPEFVRQDLEVKGNKKSLSFLLLLAVIILLIAYVNYINLSTSRTLDRAKEVGIRKVLGSGKGQLIRQFLLESVLVNLIAGWLAVTLLQLATPVFNQFTGKELSFSTFRAFYGWQGMLAVLALGAILSGLYPAFVLSSYKPVYALKGKRSSSPRGVWLRKSLVVGQFAATVALMAGTGVVYRQLQFMREKDLGIRLEETVVLNVPGNKKDFAPKIEAFKTELLQHPAIRSISASTSVPGKEIGWVTTAFRKSGENPDNFNSYTIHFVGIDHS